MYVFIVIAALVAIVYSIYIGRNGKHRSNSTTTKEDVFSTTLDNPQGKDYEDAQYYYNLLTAMSRLKKTAKETGDYTRYFVAGEESLLYLDWMLRDCIPPSIPCIQEMPHVYCICSRWDDAVRVHDVALEKGLIDKFQHDEAINSIRNTEVAHGTALEFIQNNQGVLQRDIYKKLPHIEEDTLKWVMRYSNDIKKIKSGNTYKLYTH